MNLRRRSMTNEPDDLEALLSAKEQATRDDAIARVANNIAHATLLAQIATPEQVDKAIGLLRTSATGIVTEDIDPDITQFLAEAMTAAITVLEEIRAKLA